MEMDWEDEKGTSNVSEQEEQEEKEAEEEQHARGRPVKRRRVQHHKAITTSSASSSPERERPRRRTRVSSTTRSTRLLRHLTQPVDDAEEQPSIASARLGLQQGQPSINYRDQAKRLPLRPTADGYVYNRETGLLVEDENTYMFDDDHADVNFSYLDLAERQPDFLLAREIGGLLGIEPIDMFIASNITHLKRQADSIKDVLRKNLKARDVNVATRQRLLRDFEKQKNELGVVRTRLQQLYEVMAPTVRRWYYLASMTGYMFAPAMVPDIAMQQWADTADPLPYFLLVQHAGQQYRNYRTTDLTFSIQEDAEYWEAFDTPLFVWATEFLHEYRRQIIEARALQATLARAVGQAIYLILRDAVLSSCLRLVPPLGKAPPVGPATMAPNLRPVPVPGETYQDLLKEVNLARYTWIRPLERTRTNPRGRYQGLGYHLEHIRAFVVTTDTDETQIRQQAVTKNEARGTPFPDPFKLSGRGDPAKSAALGARLRRSNMTRVNEQNLQGAASLLAATVLSLENPVAALVPRPMQRTLAFDMLRPGALRNTVEQWTVAWNELTDALGTVSTFGMMHWQQLLRVLAPVTGATNLAHYLYEALADPGFPPPHGFTWNPDDTDPLLRSNMLCYVLLQTEDDRSPGYNRIDVRSRVMPNGYARNMFTTFNVVALPATATMAHPLALRGSTATRQQVTDNETARLLVSLIVDGDTAEGVAISRAWRKLDALFPDMSTQFAALRGAPVAGTRGNMPRIEEALRLQLMSTVAWTLLLRNKPLLVQGILDAMLQDVLALEGHAAAAQAVLAALDLETDFMAGLRSRWLPLLKEYIFSQCIFVFLSHLFCVVWRIIPTWQPIFIVKCFVRRFCHRTTACVFMPTIVLRHRMKRICCMTSFAGMCPRTPSSPAWTVAMRRVFASLHGRNSTPISFIHRWLEVGTGVRVSSISLRTRHGRLHKQPLTASGVASRPIQTVNGIGQVGHSLCPMQGFPSFPSCTWPLRLLFQILLWSPAQRQVPVALVLLLPPNTPRMSIYKRPCMTPWRSCWSGHGIRTS